jgi:hypothetical protein
MRNPGRNCSARRFGDLKLNRPTGFLLKNQCSGCHALAVADVAHPKAHQVESPQFAVDSKIEQCEVPTTTCNLKGNTNRPNLFEFERRLLAHELAFIPRYVTGGFGNFHDRLLFLGEPLVCAPIQSTEANEQLWMDSREPANISYSLSPIALRFAVIRTAGYP